MHTAATGRAGNTYGVPMTMDEPRPNQPKQEQKRGKLQPARENPASDLQVYVAQPGKIS